MMASTGDKEYELITFRNEQFSVLHSTTAHGCALKQNENCALGLREG